MKIILIHFILLFVVSADASDQDMDVKVTSYSRAGVRTRSAELCGEVVNIKVPWVIVKVKIDANHKQSGNYTTIVGKDAKFCLAVVTNGGTAEVSLASLNGDLLLGKPIVVNFSNNKEF